MKKFIITVIIAALVILNTGCMPFIDMPLNIPEEIKQRRDLYYEEYFEPDEFEYEFDYEPYGYDGDGFETEYELGDIVFECGEELEYYEGDDGEAGYKLSLYHEVMLDIQMIPLEPDATEAENIDLCECAILAFLESAEENVEFDGADIEITAVDGSDAYSTVFEALSDGIPAVAADVVFATENYIYLTPVIAASQEYQDMYFDLIDSIEILNPSYYTFRTPVSQNGNTSADGDAVSAAEDYLSFMAYSYDGLVEQLEYDGFSREEAKAAVDSLEIDWDAQAAKAAREHIEYSPYSHDGLIDMLVFEGFGESQAKAAVDALGVDWTRQAVIAAAEYIEYVDITEEDELISQLEFEGFSKEDAQYGARQALYDAGY